MAASFALVFFLADLTVDICKRSSCTIRNGFEEEEVEVKYDGDRLYVGLILRIHGTYGQSAVVSYKHIITWYKSLHRN